MLSGIPSSLFVWKTRGRGRRIYLLYVSSARSPESGLLSDWSENKRSFAGSPTPIGEATYLTSGTIRSVFLPYGHLRLFMTETTR